MDTARADTMYPHIENAEAMLKIGEIFDPPTKTAEAMPKFDLDFYTDTACADTMDPDTKNVEAMPKFEAQLVIQLVSENVEGFTKCEVEAAKRAKKFYHSLGCPSIATIKNLIRMNAIRNCPVTTEDIANAKKIYGPDPSKLKVSLVVITESRFRAINMRRFAVLAFVLGLSLSKDFFLLQVTPQIA